MRGVVREVGGTGARARMTHRAGRPVLDLDRIGAATLEVLRRGDLASVTMAAVAAELGVSVRALYHYVPDRRAMLAQATMSFQRGLTPPPDTGDWRADLRAHAVGLRERFRRHPRVLEIALQAGVVAADEHFYRVQEATLARLTGLGLSPRAAWLASSELIRFVGGAALLLDGDGPGADQEVLLAANTSHVVATGDYPLTAAALGANVTSDEQFETGLRFVLDGIAGLIQR